MARGRWNGGIIGPNLKVTTSSASGIFSLSEAQVDVSAGLIPSVPPPAIPIEPQFNLTTLLLHGDSGNGNQNNTFLDESTNAFTLTRTGTATQGTFSPFSQTGWSAYFSGSSGSPDFVSTASSSTFNVSSGNWTVEAWFWTGSSDASNRYITFIPASGTTYGLIPSGSDYALNQFGTSSPIGTSGSLLKKSQWTHVAIVKNGATTYIYVDGVLGGSGTVSWSNSAHTIFFGGNGISYTYNYSGWISNARIVMGTALYTGSTYTVPTSPLTAVAGTQFLTLNNNRIYDSSGNNATVNLGVMTGPAVQPFSPFAPAAAYGVSSVGGSMFFNTTSDYLYYTDTVNGFGTGDFTIEFWVYSSSASQNILFNSTYSNNWAILFYLQSVYWQYNGSNILNTSSSVQLNAWNHVALARSSGTLTIYINGVSGASATVSTSIPTPTGSKHIGPGGGGTGTYYLSNVRIVKGTAVYTANFTPPTAPVTAITNTQLLVNGTNASIYDSTAKNNIQTSNGGFLSTTQSKFGGSSIRYPGGVYHITTAGPQNSLGNGDFTIEFWIWFDGVGSQRPLSQGTYAAGEYVLIFNANGSFDWAESGTTRCSAPSSTYSAGAWYHIAIVRSGLTTSAYVNGTQTGTTYTPASNYNFNSTAGIYIGGNPNTPSQTFTGYIDELRITVGVARYTANFSVATSAYPNQ